MTTVRYFHSKHHDCYTRSLQSCIVREASAKNKPPFGPPPRPTAYRILPTGSESEPAWELTNLEPCSESPTDGCPPDSGLMFYQPQDRVCSKSVYRPPTWIQSRRAAVIHSAGWLADPPSPIPRWSHTKDDHQPCYKRWVGSRPKFPNYPSHRRCRVADSSLTRFLRR